MATSRYMNLQLYYTLEALFKNPFKGNLPKQFAARVQIKTAKADNIQKPYISIDEQDYTLTTCSKQNQHGFCNETNSCFGLAK